MEIIVRVQLMTDGAKSARLMSRKSDGPLASSNQKRWAYRYAMANRSCTNRANR
jgi:hypothetical protein